MPTLQPGVAVLAFLLLTAGCLGGPAAGTGTTPTDVPSATPTPTLEPPTETPTPEPYSHEDAMNEPDADKSIVVENGWNRTVEMHVEVVREATNETVHEDTHEVEAGAERAVYDTMEADPDGVESFRVAVTARGTTDRVTIETSGCYGDAHASVRDDGTVYLYYAIC